MPKMNFKNFSKIFIVIAILVSAYILGQKLLTYSDLVRHPIRSVFVDSDCSVSILIGNRTRHFNLGRDVINSDCYDLASPAISRDGKFAMFETRLILEGEKKLNAVYVYGYENDMWSKVYDYGTEKIKNLAFDKDNNLYIDSKIIPFDDYEVNFDVLDKKVTGLVKDLPEVKLWLKGSENREVHVEDVDDDVILVRVYEYFEKDNRTKTFNWYEYNRITGELTKLLKIK